MQGLPPVPIAFSLRRLGLSWRMASVNGFRHTDDVSVLNRGHKARSWPVFLYLCHCAAAGKGRFTSEWQAKSKNTWMGESAAQERCMLHHLEGRAYSCSPPFNLPMTMHWNTGINGDQPEWTNSEEMEFFSNLSTAINPVMSRYGGKAHWSHARQDGKHILEGPRHNVMCLVFPIVKWGLSKLAQQ